MPIELVNIILDMDQDDLLQVLKELEKDDKEAYDTLAELVKDIA